MLFIFLIFFSLGKKSFAYDIFEENVSSTCILPEPFWNAYRFLFDENNMLSILVDYDSIDILNEIILQLDVPLVISELYPYQFIGIMAPDDYRQYDDNYRNIYIRKKEINILILLNHYKGIKKFHWETLNADDKIIIVLNLRNIRCKNENIMKNIASRILKYFWYHGNIIQV